MSLSLVLKPRVLRTYDSDAASYITAVESADNQALESGIKEAINEFVVGCKVRGIWDAIKSCCLLCGARTLNGAIVPLKGSAPILTDFVGDYNRETGLRRTSGSFNINRNNNADPADNKHVAIYPTSLDYGSSVSNFRALLTASTAAGSTSFALNSSGLNAKVNTTLNLIANEPVISGNLIGISVLNSSTSQLLYNNIIGTKNIDIITPVNISMALFAGSGVSTSLSRISYYSVGERLDLRLLKQVVDIFNERLRAISYPTSLHPEARNWISIAETNNQPKITATLAGALNTFCNSIDSANLRNKFYRLNLFCGPTLETALLPLYKGPTFSGVQYGNFIERSINFASNNYSELGLLGNGTSAYLDPGVLTSTINTLYPSIHFSVYGNNIPSSPLNKAFIFTGTGSGGSNYALCQGRFSTQWTNHIAGEWNNGGIYEDISSSKFGMKIISRTATNLVKLYSNGLYVGQSTTSLTSPPEAIPSSQTIRLFTIQIQGTPPSSFIDLRASGYSMGLGMDDGEAEAYYNIMQAFQTTLGRQV